MIYQKKLLLFLVFVSTVWIAVESSTTAAPAIPDFTTSPTVRTTLEDTITGSKQYRFFCDFTNADTTLFYQASWYINGIFKHKSSFVAINDTQDRSLTDADLFNVGVKTVGFNISCRIRASFSDESQAGQPFGSKETFIGIEVLNQVTPLTLREGEAGYLELRSTAPIGCRTGTDCVYVMTLQIPSREQPCSLTLRGYSSCGVEIKTSGNSKLTLIAGVTSHYGTTSQAMEIILKSGGSYFNHAIWGNYTMKAITVLVSKNTTTGIEQRQCQVYSGSRIYTFGKRFTSLQNRGPFTMYENKQYNIEVQVETIACSFFGGYCVCGLVARVGRTVFMIYHCNIDHWFIDYTLCGDGGDVLDVKKYGSSYKFTFPHGALLHMDIRRAGSQHWLNSYIYPSVVDVGVSGGLCGYLTGYNYNALSAPDERILRDGTTAANDSAFFTSWGVCGDKSLFKSATLEQLEQLRNYTYQNCQCNNPGSGFLINEIVCTASNMTDTCTPDNKGINTKRCLQPQGSSTRDMTQFEKDSRKQKWAVPHANLSIADNCQLLLNSTNMVQACRGLPSDLISTLVESCEENGNQVFNETISEYTMERFLNKMCSYEITCPGECGPSSISLLPGSDLVTPAGENLRVTCTSQCKPACQYSWYQDGDYMIDGNTLTLLRLKTSQQYVCSVHNIHGTRNITLKLTVEALSTVGVTKTSTESTVGVTKTSTESTVGGNADRGSTEAGVGLGVGVGIGVAALLVVLIVVVSVVIVVKRRNVQTKNNSIAEVRAVPVSNISATIPPPSRDNGNTVYQQLDRETRREDMNPYTELRQNNEHGHLGDVAMSNVSPAVPLPSSDTGTGNGNTIYQQLDRETRREDMNPYTDLRQNNEHGHLGDVAMCNLSPTVPLPSNDNGNTIYQQLDPVARREEINPYTELRQNKQNEISDASLASCNYANLNSTSNLYANI